MKYENWKGPYSFAEYADAFAETVDGINKGGISWAPDDEESLANGFWMRFPVPSSESYIIEEVSRCSVIVNEITDIALRSLETQVIDGSLMVSFDFPEDIKVPCEQYLLYFVQFLKDLGVEATSNLEHQAGQVLFSVTPTNEEDALDKIRDTLDLYLRFPSSPISDISNEPIAIQRLEANILHLRSDLKLASAELQAKNATIQAQQLTIDIQKGILSGEIVVDSLRNVTPKAEDKEPLLGGIVALATVKGKGLEVNLGELFRQLKKKFSK